MSYKPSKKSLNTHRVPSWFEDAKLGVFIHWGLYSVPGWAPPEKNLDGIPTNHATSPYAEWYENTMKIEGSPTRDFHNSTYGPNFSYADFRKEFLAQSARADMDAWAQFIQDIGGKYAIFTTKHHDGYNLWPTRNPNPRRGEWNTERDFVGELTKALRKRGLRSGAYYSAIWDWSFQEEPIQDEYTMLINGDGSHRYARYAHNQFRELIDRYAPDILYNDIGYPVRGRLEELLAHYYNTVPEGVANNRWIRWRIPDNRLIRSIVRGILKLKDSFMKVDWGGTDMKIGFGDYATPEFQTVSEVIPQKWECIRGLGSSFGFNKLEDDDPSLMLSGDELIRLFVDIVSKNGNLAINIGPRPDGSIPQSQRAPLEALGAWMKVNGDHIYGTRPWKCAEACVGGGEGVSGGASGSGGADGGSVRFAKKDHNLIIYLSHPGTGRDSFGPGEVFIQGLALPSDSQPSLNGVPVSWEKRPGGTLLHLPADANPAVPVISIPRAASRASIS